MKLFLIRLKAETFWSCPDDGKPNTEMSLYGSVYLKTSLPLALANEMGRKERSRSERKLINFVGQMS